MQLHRPCISTVFCFTFLLTAIAHGQALLPGLERSSLDEKLGGRVLLGEMNCVSCHQSASTDLSASSRKAPRLNRVGGRIHPRFLEEFIANPHKVKPGTLMPDMLAGMDDGERRSTAEAITHYLVSLNQGSREFTPQAPDAVAASLGEKLFHSVGCVACHSPRDPDGKALLRETSVPLGELEKKYSHRSLTEFLRQPHATRPSGRMPNLNLPGHEVERIAHYLLRKTKVPGRLAYMTWRGKVWEGLDGDVTKDRAGHVDDFSLTRFGKVAHQTAIRYQGYLDIKTPGNYTFHLEMNGGTLALNGTEVAGESPSNRRGPKKLKGSAMLQAGWNRIEVTYFQTGREPRFRFEMEGPGFARGPIPSSMLSISDKPIPVFKPLKVDPKLLSEGKQHFERLGCVQCHDDIRANKDQRSLPALADLDPLKGCLSDTPVSGKEIPRFDLSQKQKELIRAVLPTVEKAKLSDAEQVNRSLVAFNCIACHDRKGLGGIDPVRNSYFTGTREALGNQGRIPPPLTHVGSKLTREWMTEVLLRGGRQREYLSTRMPQFGEANVGHLVEKLEKVDQSSLEVADIPKVNDIRESKDAGYQMMGAGGLSCIACHDFNGQRSGGAGAMDLVNVTSRLKKNWFHLYLREPQRFHPAVIMPSYWPGGQSVRKEPLGGDPDRQIEALWDYLSDGDRAKSPKGLSRQSLELRVADETVMCRGRGTSAGYRGIGVGYPERISLAFNSEEMSLRMLWSGEFASINHGRFSARGRDRIEFPAGIPFHRLESMDDAWPYKGKTNHAFPQDHGYQYRGYQLDKAKRPTFKYHYGDVAVADYFEDLLDTKGGPFFRRTLTFSTPSDQESFFFRVASGRQVQEKGQPGAWQIDRLNVRLRGDLKAIVREGDPRELLVPLKLSGGETVIELEYQW